MVKLNKFIELVALLMGDCYGSQRMGDLSCVWDARVSRDRDCAAPQYSLCARISPLCSRRLFLTRLGCHVLGKDSFFHRALLGAEFMGRWRVERDKGLSCCLYSRIPIAMHRNGVATFFKTGTRRLEGALQAATFFLRGLCVAEGRLAPLPQSPLGNTSRTT